MTSLSNFRLVLEHGFATRIEADGLTWDLHGRADFLGLAYGAQSRTATLSWRFLGDVSPPRPPALFDLTFRETDYLEVAPRDREMPPEEDRTLDTVSFMEATDDLRDYRHNSVIPSFDPATGGSDVAYHVLFRFRGGQMVRIGAREAEFVLRPDTAPSR